MASNTSGQMDPHKKASGKVNSYGDLMDAMNFHINRLLGKEPTQKQKDAVAGLTPVEDKEAKKAAREALPPKPEPRPQRAPPLDRNQTRDVKPAPRPVSAMDAAQAVARDAKQLAGQAGEGRASSGSSRPSTVNTQSKKPLAKRIMEALGDKRTMKEASDDARVTKEMEMEREMNVAGRKKGGMAKKKKAPVKKAYGGMVKKKHGGSANKVNMKAGFTRRGCSKG
jgi:hypothetical protein